MTTIDKAHFRQKICRILGGIDPEVIHEKSEKIARRLFATACWKEARIVLAYIAMKGEVDTLPVYTHALREGKRIAAPRIEGKELVFYCFNNLSEGFKVNCYGIREPDPENKSCNGVLDWNSNTDTSILIVTPGLAFDRKKNRLGRGGGYYDRFLSITKSVSSERHISLGVSFQEQLFNSIPHNENDQRVDMLITEEELIL